MPTIFLQVALNGDSIHPAAPRTPAAIAEAARAAADAGAQSVHVHAFDDAGRETLEGAAGAQVLRAIRARCPATPISLTTSAAIVADPGERFRIVEAWEELPDLVTANQGEPRIVELCELLLSRGVGIEAGLLTSEDARAFVRSGLAARCRRVLIEPLDADLNDALRHAARMEDIVVSAASRSSRFTTVMARRVGRSIDVASNEGTASGPGWKTSRYCLTVGRHGTMLIWSLQPRV
jgi:uncharacterized protein (DUF849 family)